MGHDKPMSRLQEFLQQVRCVLRCLRMSDVAGKARCEADILVEVPVGSGDGWPERRRGSVLVQELV
jgi:hypothetical protein